MSGATLGHLPSDAGVVTRSRCSSWWVALALLGCGVSKEETPQPAATGGRTAVAAAVPAPVHPQPDAPSCAERIERARALESLPGVPELDAQRPRIFARAKAEPVLFVRPPGHDPTEDAWVKSYRKQLERARHPWGTLAAILPRLIEDRRRARLVLLREGYVFAAAPELAFALSDQLRLDHLFSGEPVRVQRGQLVLHAERDAHRRYVWSDGTERGKPARLLLFDRVGKADDTLPPPLHRDLRDLRNRLHFDALRVLRSGERQLEVELRYGTIRIPTLLESSGSRLALGCEVASAAERELLSAHRDRSARQLRVVEALREVMREQIDEQLPFDEPLTEVGQQDGRLRPRWQTALRSGASDFTFNTDKYRVFDDCGRPLAPQVCFDFLMDTLERASGTRWLTRAEGGGRRVGKLDFEEFGGDALRSADRFLAWVSARPDWFELDSISTSRRIRLGQEAKLVDFLLHEPKRFLPGDMLVIFGWTPWDPYERHYHSVFVYETDPVTGFPMLIAGNAGRPSVRTWHTEAVRTPRRQIIHRIRPRLEWLERIVEPERGRSVTPAPIVEGS
jgi:hypothetical protein